MSGLRPVTPAPKTSQPSHDCYLNIHYKNSNKVVFGVSSRSLFQLGKVTVSRLPAAQVNLHALQVFIISYTPTPLSHSQSRHTDCRTEGHDMAASTRTYSTKKRGGGLQAPPPCPGVGKQCLSMDAVEWLVGERAACRPTLAAITSCVCSIHR